jgi:large conductance mechanosensitive channel
MQSTGAVRPRRCVLDSYTAAPTTRARGTQEVSTMIREFREFIMRGNVVDLAIAVVIGAAFGAVITSFVADILTPLLGAVGLPDFKTAAVTVGTAEVRYGLFLNALISFLAIALAIFLFVVKPMNALEARRQRGAEETPTTKTCSECASEIPSAARRCPFCAQPQPS